MKNFSKIQADFKVCDAMLKYAKILAKSQDRAFARAAEHNIPSLAKRRILAAQLFGAQLNGTAEKHGLKLKFRRSIFSPRFCGDVSTSIQEMVVQ